MPPHPLINFDIEKYFQNEHKFTIVYSRSNLSKTKYVIYVINLDECKLAETHWIALYVNGVNLK